jgi:Glycosyl hydrolases family 16
VASCRPIWLELTGIDNNGQPITGLSNVHDNFHDYEIDWQPDSITWSIDGNVVRTLEKESTWNETANRYSYPQTPCQVQLSLWPGGLESNGEGTIAWAGGLVTWNDPSMVNGYYYAAFDSVEMQCYDPPPGARTEGDKSYIYTDVAMTNASVEITNDDTILASFLASGIDMNKGNKTGNSPQSSDVATIPGLTGTGPGSNNHDNGTSSSDSGNGLQGTSVATGTGSASTGFVQGDGGTGNGASHVGGNGEQVLQGSLFAVVVAIIGLCVL